MSNCMTCRYNDLKAKFCPVMGVHTDLGYVLNCAAWAPTDRCEMKRLKAEVAKLQKLVEDMWFWFYCKNVYQKSDKEQAVIIGGIIARMGDLGIEPKFTEEDE